MPIQKEMKNYYGHAKLDNRHLSDNDKKDIFQRDLEEEFSVSMLTATGILQLMEKNNWN